MKIAAFSALALAMLFATAHAEDGRTVRCKVRLFGQVLHEGGGCKFSDLGGGDGSFYLDFRKGFAYVNMEKGGAHVAVNLSPVGNGELDVGSHAHTDIDGVFRRSKKDRACWVSAEGEICAW